jgi:S-DNA-T family DNA segregation ATPase FtsK/SpoIIIE
VLSAIRKAEDVGGFVRFVSGMGRVEREWDLAIRRPEACVADLAAALGVAGHPLTVDGRPTAGDTALTEAGLVNGSRVAVGGRVAARDHGPRPVLRVVGGLSAGASVPLRGGTSVVGRDSEADITVRSADVSRAHCSIEVMPDGGVVVRDMGSRNGTDVNGVRLTGPARVGPDDLVSLGGPVLLRVVPVERRTEVVPVNPVREARPGGLIPFNRSPRVARPAGPPPVMLPARPSKAGKAPFSVAAMLGPIVMAAGIVAITGSWQFAAIAGLSPLMFLGNFVEERTRGRRSLRRAMREYAGQVAAADAELSARHASEVATRRADSPDLAEVSFRAAAPARRLWERRLQMPDFGQVSVGYADQSWQPPVQMAPSAPGAGQDAKSDVVAKFATLPQVPVLVDLSAGGVAGIEGDRPAALAAARAMLCQAVVASGPADLTVAVFTDPGRLADWDWTKWLPHGADPTSGSARLVAVGHEQSEQLARALLAAAAAQTEPGQVDRPVTLVVVDGATLLEGRPCLLRDLLASAASACGGIVLTNRLPALCTSVLSVTNTGLGRLRRVASGEDIDDILVNGIDEYDARLLARSLARFEDPELRMRGAGLPDRINLLPLLDLPDVSGDAVLSRWADRAVEYRVGAVLGVTERDLFTVDLDDDGPHGLIAGTTGSGKSELLRTLVTSMAVGTSPEQLTFALVDYKGGGALDECARLPHVVGLVTDLDEQLGERALRCLEAELRHREHALRAVGLGHVRDYQRLRDTERPDLEPMPRLVVLIDEFATLVKALPDFVDSLVSIAQRGRSLGMHLIMATQRPAGSVNDAIKNNVKLRIALRLESSSDSIDVVDDPASAGIGSRQWGRAYYRLSAREVLPVQTALSTGVTPATAVTSPVSVRPFALGFPDPDERGTADPGATDLARLVAAVGEANDMAGYARPRRPWPQPLPPLIGLADLPPQAVRGLGGETADETALPAVALADDPDRQTQYPVGWSPGAGNLLVYGAVGAGTSTTLISLALAMTASWAPGRLHLYVLDLGAGDLAPLGALPHAGAYIGAAERERQIRLIRTLRRDLEARKSLGAQRTRTLVVIDNLGALLADFDSDAAGMSILDDLARVYADGPAVGIHVAATADRAGAVPPSWSALTQQKLLMRLADHNEYGTFDVHRKAVPGYVPGRALIAGNQQVVQVAHPGTDLGAAVRRVAARWPAATRIAPPVGLLPQRVTFAELGAEASVTEEPWEIPVGVGDAALAPAALCLFEHEHALITGPPRSGRSLALCTIAHSVLATPGAPAVVAFAPRRSPVRDLPAPVTVVTGYDDLDAALSAVGTGPLLVLVDDAETIEDGLGVLDRWLAGAGTARHLVAAGRADGLRRMYGNWTQKVRDGRNGVLLVPDHDLDGDLLGVTLPRTDRMAPVPGRGYHVANGSVDGIQLALPVPAARKMTSTGGNG